MTKTPQHIMTDRMTQLNATLPLLAHHCLHCGEVMGPAIFLGPVCGRCCRHNQHHAS